MSVIQENQPVVRAISSTVNTYCFASSSAFCSRRFCKYSSSCCLISSGSIVLAICMTVDGGDFFTNCPYGNPYGNESRDWPCSASILGRLPSAIHKTRIHLIGNRRRNGSNKEPIIGMNDEGIVTCQKQAACELPL